MKHTRIIPMLIICFVLVLSAANAQSTLQVSFKAINTIEGYDHISKLIVYCDGEKVGESIEKKQSLPNKVKVKVPSGDHLIHCSLWAKYDGVWEVRTLANDYSFDWMYDKQMTLKKGNNAFKIVFDVDKQTVTEP